MDYTSLALLVSLFTGGFAGSGVFLIYQLLFNKQREKKIEKETSRILNKAQSEAYRIEKKAEIKAQDLLIKMKKQIEEEQNETAKKLHAEHERLQLRQARQEHEFLKQKESLKEQEQELKLEKVKLEEKETHLQDLQKQKEDQLNQLKYLLENASQLSQEEAKQELIYLLEEDVKANIAPKLKKIEDQLKQESEIRSKNILARVIARHASAVTTEKTTTVLTLSGDEVKGKIIGREGRNIRAIENSCGVDVLIEEGQGGIVLSCFDPVRREIAKTAIHRLIKDGRVHPSRIEEVVEKVKTEIFKTIQEVGEKTCFELNLHDVHPQIVKILGGLHFKTINGRNALKVSVDMALLAGHIMSELGGDEKRVKRAALLHCIGLNVDHRVEGSYAEVGADVAKKYREKPDIVHAILCHNSAVPAETLLDHVVQAGFNLYQSIPGVKSSNIESFISRMKNAESIANSFAGVIRSYAIRAGKEVRVLVDSSQVTDNQSIMLCSDIVKKLEREIHSHQIKVSVIRESRIVEHAR